MKKTYKKPATTHSVANLNALCIGIVGSTDAESGNLTKEEQEEEEEFEAFIATIEAEQKDGQMSLW